MRRKELTLWQSVIKCLKRHLKSTSLVTPCVSTPKTFRLILCGVVSACSGNDDLLSPAQSVPVPSVQLGDRALRDNVQSPRLTCRGFINICPLWTVHRVPNRPLAINRGPLPPRGANAP